MDMYLAGDIGGTKTLLSLLDSKLQQMKKQEYASSKYPSLEAIIKDFLEGQDSYPKKACFAIAGPVMQKRCKLTNLPWEELDEIKLQNNLGLEKVSLINDFVANIYNIVLEENKQIYTLQEGSFDPDSPIGVLGAGTGLGKGFAVPLGNKKFQVFPSEGGHSDYSPRNELEINLLKALSSKYKAICQDKFNLQEEQVKMLSLDEEAILSGPGILDIFDVLKSDFSNVLAEEILAKPLEKQAEAISISATQKTNGLAEKTMDVFIEAYGAISGNFALNLLPFGGLYIAGGIAAKNLDLIKAKKDLFLNAFNSKVRVNPSLLQRVPIHIVTNKLTGLNGAINYVSKI
ncbi:MAG: glucokinase [Crocosphaera sp.]